MTESWKAVSNGVHDGAASWRQVSRTFAPGLWLRRAPLAKFELDGRQLKRLDPDRSGIFGTAKKRQGHGAAS